MALTAPKEICPPETLGDKVPCLCVPREHRDQAVSRDSEGMAQEVIFKLIVQFLLFAIVGGAWETCPCCLQYETAATAEHGVSPLEPPPDGPRRTLPRGELVAFLRQ